MNTDANDANVEGMYFGTSYTDSEHSQQQQPKQKTSMPTIYPNDFDFNVPVTGFGTKSTTSRSFIRPTRTLSKEHRNISVPNSLKV